MNKKIGAVVIILGLVIGIAYFVRNDGSGTLSKLSKNECPRVFSPVSAAEPYYKGELFDAHLHLPTAVEAVSTVSIKIGLPTPTWDNELSLKYLHCLFGKEGVRGAYGFHLFTKYSQYLEVNKTKEMERKYPGVVMHFLMPTMVGPNINPDISTVRKILAENPGLFRGMGELKMYDGKSPDDPYVLGLLDLAREYKLIVMMHPFNEHKAAIEKIVKQYSDVTFLLHDIDYLEEDGGKVVDNRDWLKKLMTNNDNVYYSIDGGLPIYGWSQSHKGTVVPKEEILQNSKSRFKSQLNQDLSRYKSLIEAYPNRFLRGTDRWYRPHYDKEVSALMEEYSRAFIGRLTPSVQEKFAHENAERLLGKE